MGNPIKVKEVQEFCCIFHNNAQLTDMSEGKFYCDECGTIYVFVESVSGAITGIIAHENLYYCSIHGGDVALKETPTGLKCDICGAIFLFTESAERAFRGVMISE